MSMTAATTRPPERLRVLRARDGAIRVLRHDRRCGKTAALITGIGAARAPWIVTMDGDGQDDAAEIPRLLELAWAAGEPSPLVAGIRTTRRDRWSRRLATKFANGLRQKLLRDGCPDTACGLKAFRRDVFLRLPAFEGMHRFLPALFQTFGHPLVCCSGQSPAAARRAIEIHEFRPRRRRGGGHARHDLAAAAHAAAGARRRGMSRRNEAGAGLVASAPVSAAGPAVGGAVRAGAGEPAAVRPRRVALSAGHGADVRDRQFCRYPVSGPAALSAAGRHLLAAGRLGRAVQRAGRACRCGRIASPRCSARRPRCC